MVRAFEEKCVQKERRSLKNDAVKHASEMGMRLDLRFPTPEVFNDEGERINPKAVEQEWKKKEKRLREKAILDQQWQGKFYKTRWENI